MASPKSPDKKKLKMTTTESPTKANVEQNTSTTSPASPRPSEVQHTTATEHLIAQNEGDQPSKAPARYSSSDVPSTIQRMTDAQATTITKQKGSGAAFADVQQPGIASAPLSTFSTQGLQCPAPVTRPTSHNTSNGFSAPAKAPSKPSGVLPALPSSNHAGQASTIEATGSELKARVNNAPPTSGLATTGASGSSPLTTAAPASRPSTVPHATALLPGQVIEVYAILIRFHIVGVEQELTSITVCHEGFEGAMRIAKRIVAQDIRFRSRTLELYRTELGVQ